MKKFFSLIIVLLLMCGPVFAEMQIGEFVIEDGTTSEQVISYVFQLLVGIGALIAVIMVIAAGIEWMTSDGNPSKIGNAKGKIKNALLGVTILLGSYLILNEINPDITEIEIDELACETGIIVKTKSVTMEDGKIIEGKTKCIQGTMNEIKYEIEETINIDKWNFPEKTILKVYVYTESNFGGDPTIIEMKQDGSIGGEIGEAKSIYFLPRYYGVYLYDGSIYRPRDEKHPLFTYSSIKDLSSSQFNNKTRSIQIIDEKDEDKENKEKYSVVAFSGPNYTGRCAYINVDRKWLGDGVEEEDLSSSYIYGIPKDTISSIIVNKSIDNDAVTRGEVVLYTTQNCGQGSNMNIPTVDLDEGVSLLPGEESEDFPTNKKCTIDIQNSVYSENINMECDEFEDGDDVMSMQINGPAGVVLTTTKIRDRYNFLPADEKTLCQYFEQKGTCINIVHTDVYTMWGDKPKAFMIIPTE